ncbi:MAG: thiamine pyrophosphate-binding protein [Paracoccaceae bacterium]
MAYTDEKTTQIVIFLLKSHGIKHVIASPGTTNMAFVGSVQRDPHFVVHSSVDERSAAYMACGLAAQTGEPVVLSCTGATASRNYLPGLTEAFYRKLPVIALTSMQGRERAGHHIAQVIDRSALPKDAAKLSVDLPVGKDAEDTWEAEMKVNQAILETRRGGGAPVHINLPTTYSQDFTVAKLPNYRKIDRWFGSEELPKLEGKIAVFVGAHKPWTPKETQALDRFCDSHDAVVLCDHTSGYDGKYRIQGALLGAQEGQNRKDLKADVTIHIGEITGDYQSEPLIGKEVWRVSPDGEVRDTFRRLRHVFEMSEADFFTRYTEEDTQSAPFYDLLRSRLVEARSKISEMPFSNLWMASQFSKSVPNDAVMHFAILNSLRAWNFFDLSKGVHTMSNVGGFGIDGCMSSLIGASLADPDKIFYLVTGDLAFFYDLNALGNRQLGANVRILLVNNGRGTEFTQHGHLGAQFGPDAATFIAAEGHFGPKSRALAKGYAEALGLEYMGVTGKAECTTAAQSFFDPMPRDCPMLLEAFVDADDESDALRMIKNLYPAPRNTVRKAAKDLLGPQKIKAIRKVIKA